MDDLQHFLENLDSNAPITAALIFIFLRAMAIVLPPIPGLPLDLMGAALFGWQYGLLLGEIGIMMGAMAAFWLARSIRDPFLSYIPKKILKEEDLSRWIRHLERHARFGSLLILRLITNPAFDFISYAAGFTRISTSSFFWATFIGSAPACIAVYYFGALAIGYNLAGSFILMALVLIAWALYNISIR